MLSAITLDDSVERCRLDSVSLPLPNISQQPREEHRGGDAAPAPAFGKTFGLCTQVHTNLIDLRREGGIDWRGKERQSRCG